MIGISNLILMIICKRYFVKSYIVSKLLITTSLLNKDKENEASGTALEWKSYGRNSKNYGSM